MLTLDLSVLKRLLLCSAILIAALVPALAQSGATLKKGNVEAGAFVGTGYGLGNPNGGNYHIMGGGDFGYAITRSVFLVGEVSYFPSLGDTISRSDPNNKGEVEVHSYKRRVTEYNGGVHLRLPVPARRVVPYLVAGMGGVHFYDSKLKRWLVDKNGVKIQDLQDDTIRGDTGFALNAGAGLRVYATEHFGFRGEFKIIKPYSIPNLDSFYRFAGGIFFQFR
jgi:hypothetical protein